MKTTTDRGEKSPQSTNDRKARQRARDAEALDWYAQNPFEHKRYPSWPALFNIIKHEFAIAQGFDNWKEFCKSDNPKRWTK